MSQLGRRAAILFLPAAVVLLGALLAIYVVTQQEERQGANEMPAALANDAVRQLDAGVTPERVTEALPAVDIGSSLQAWVAVYDRSGKPLSSSGRLDGEPPAPPSGVFDSARSGEDRVTWQPRPGVRQATVVVAYDHGYVIGGRSLREVEARIDRIGELLVAAAAAGMVGLAAASLIAARLDTWLSVPAG